MANITHLNPISTDESLADQAREILENNIKEGIVGVIFIFENQDGWKQVSAPESSFLLYGGISLAYKSIAKALKTEEV